MDFDKIKNTVTTAMDEKAKSGMKEMVDDFYSSSKKTKDVGDEEEKVEK